MQGRPRRLWPLIALGIGAYVLFALVTLPASLLASRLAPLGVNAAGVDGTVWKGRAQVLQIGAFNLGSANWDLHVLPLFTGRVQAEVKASRVDGFAQGVVAVSSGKTRLSALTASLPLSAFPASVFPGGWSGTANVKLRDLVLEKGWPVTADGTIEAMDLVGPARRPANIGSYKLIFVPATQPSDTLEGALSDLSGPLQIAGTLHLKNDRSYLVEGFVTTRPDTPRNVADALQFLGAPDAQGRRPFSLAGTM